MTTLTDTQIKVRRDEILLEMHSIIEMHRGMDYARYRAAGLFIGSGVVEAGCKKVIGPRFKASGMFWSEPGARNLLHIRTALLSQNRFKNYWAARSVPIKVA